MVERGLEGSVAGWQEVPVSSLHESGTSADVIFLGLLKRLPSVRVFRHQGGSLSVVAAIDELERLETRKVVNFSGDYERAAWVLIMFSPIEANVIAGAIECFLRDAGVSCRLIYLVLHQSMAALTTTPCLKQLVGLKPAATVSVGAAIDDGTWRLYPISLDGLRDPGRLRDLLSRGVQPGPVEGPGNLEGREKWFQRRFGGDD